MDGSARTTLQWADGEHSFRLAIGQLRELQDKCSAGPMEILGRLGTGTWRVDDIRETIRLGLIGGGKTPTDAHILTMRYVDERPLVENVAVAQGILLVALIGNPDDKVGKAKAGKTKRKARPASSSRHSMEPAQP